MATQITIDSDQVMAIASQIENDNQQLHELLGESKTTVDSLTAYWTGPAAEETIASYDSFAGRFFQTYFDILDQYVRFLRNNVSAGYEQIEQVNKQLADAFK